MRACIFGAGAIGGHLAARLAAGGADVSLVARGETLRALRSAGLAVSAPDREMHLRPAASDDAAELGPQDVVFVTVKAPALPVVARGIAPLLHEDTAVVFTINGVPWWYYAGHGGALAETRLPRIDPGDAVWSAVGPKRTIGSVIYSPCTVIEPAVVRVEGPSRLFVGEIDGRMSTRVQAIAEVLGGGGLPTEVTPHIRDRVWQKLVDNLSVGPTAILTRANLRQMFEDPGCQSIIRRVIAEGLALARALGHEIAGDADERIARGRLSDHKPSILQDLEAGRPMEVDAQLVAPLDMARQVGLATPTLDILVALATLRARTAGLYDGAA